MTPEEALKHPDKPGAGAEKRKHLTSREDKIRAVMHEFERGTLRDSHGKHVTDKKQAMAIAMSEADEAENSVKNSLNILEYL